MGLSFKAGDLDADVEHALTPAEPGSHKSTTYQFRGSAGTNMYITIGTDEFGVVCSMFINVASSGSTVHNVCNALARVISIAIQNDKATLLQIVQTMENVKSEVVWINDKLGKADSIPAVIALVLLKHIEIEEELERVHTDFSEPLDD
jgi:hypothetical protein